MILAFLHLQILIIASPRYAGMILKDISFCEKTKASPRYAGMIPGTFYPVQVTDASPRYAGMILASP